SGGGTFVESRDQHIEVLSVVDELVDYRSATDVVQETSSRLANDGQSDVLFACKLADGSGHVRTFELHDLGAHALCSLNVLDEASLNRRIDTVASLARGLHVDAIPVGVETAGDPAGLA